MFALDAILFTQHTQIQFIQWFLEEIINKAVFEHVSVLLLQKGETFPRESKKRKKEKHRNAIASILCEDEQIMDSSPKEKFVQYLQWVMQQNPLHLTWCVLAIIYISDAAKTKIAGATHPHVVQHYLVPFNARFEQHVCGVLCHSKQQKKSSLKIQAKSPTEIVLHEWLFAKKCFMTQGVGEQ